VLSLFRSALATCDCSSFLFSTRGTI
jgi:hypothetical protein